MLAMVLVLQGLSRALVGSAIVLVNMQVCLYVHVWLLQFAAAP
jgi:hypothetical protein